MDIFIRLISTQLQVNSKKGHDSFLIEPEKYGFIKKFLDEEQVNSGKAPEYATKYAKSSFTRV